MKMPNIRRGILIVFTLLSVSILLSIVIVQLMGETKSASAQSTASNISAVSPEETSDAKRFNCTIKEIDEWIDGGSSVLIGCNPGDGDISFFAQSTNDAKRASRILAIALTAVALGKQVWIQYDPDDKNVTGCSVANCRMIIGMGMNN